MGYIKSYSNYVIKNKHQLTNDGVIYERDITTIGGINRFSKGQIPIYQSGNFIITVNQEPSINKDYTNVDWLRNESGETWTLSDITSSSNVDNNIYEVSKQDYYKLKDFSYYGSCSELIRSSITDIIDRFPGELFSPIIKEDDNNSYGINMYYTDKKITNADKIKLEYVDDDDSILEYLLDNPFNIDLHSNAITDDEYANSLKYFCNNGFKNYKIIDKNKNEYQINTWSICNYSCGELVYCNYINSSNNECLCSSKCENDMLISKIYINYGNNKLLKIAAMKDESNNIIYLVRKEDLELHIRPNTTFYNEFIKSLDSFQSVLLNTKSDPKYSVLFEIIRENSFGYYTEMKRFTFPTTFGGYNLSVNDPAYATYLNELAEIAAYYDENFCDNLYRSMTHESIKNFDWSYSREYNISDYDEYIFGGTRMQNMLRLIGREFDEIKYYIDGITKTNVLSYNSNNNMPYYFLSDSLSNDGWDLTNITPMVKNSNNEFIELSSLTVKPYSSSNAKSEFINGYFVNFSNNDNCKFLPSYVNANDKTYTVNNGVLKTKIKQYFSEKEYTIQEINNIFLKILRLNSRQLYRHKGTIEGIEMMLSLFGLRSKNWYNKKVLLDYKDKYSSSFNETEIKNNIRLFSPYKNETTKKDTSTYDYEIKEYICVTKPIEDNFIQELNDYEIDWYNKTKTITYDTDEYRNGIYEEYQGLPIKYYDVDNTRYLVPYFNNNDIIDGNPYYQMNGGWLHKSHEFNANNNLVSSGYTYTETVKNSPSVDNIRGLLSIPYNELTNNTVYYVRDIDTNYIIIDGIVYELFTEYYNNEEFYYFTVTMSNNCVKIGQQVFIDDVAVSSPFGLVNSLLNDNNPEEIYYFSNYDSGLEIRIYINNTNWKCSARNSFILETSYLNATIFKDKEIYTGQTNSSNDEKHYFKIINRDNKNIISSSGNGWVQLQNNDNDVIRIINSENYFNGNNPHTGNLSYDSGNEYKEYFNSIFKYVIENDEFDNKCYGKTYDEIKNILKEKGFKNITDIADNKIISVCDYLNNDGSKVYYNEYIKTANNSEYNISKLYPSKFTSTEGFTEQIINLKVVDIIFKINPNNSDNISYIRYIDKVIIKYLSQMIPSNSIINIIYDEK